MTDLAPLCAVALVTGVIEASAVESSVRDFRHADCFTQWHRSDVRNPCPGPDVADCQVPNGRTRPEVDKSPQLVGNADTPTVNLQSAICNLQFGVVGPLGIEPRTACLKGRCSTTELGTRAAGRTKIVARRWHQAHGTLHRTAPGTRHTAPSTSIMCPTPSPARRRTMRPTSIVGLLLIVAGLAVLLMGGFSVHEIRQGPRRRPARSDGADARASAPAADRRWPRARRWSGAAAGRQQEEGLRPFRASKCRWRRLTVRRVMIYRVATH